MAFTPCSISRCNIAAGSPSPPGHAERERIPDAYLEQLIATLRKAGLVTSVRGAQGGYMLARPPQAITVGEILRVMEGELASVDCLEEANVCDKACACPTRLVWQKIHTGVNAIVDGTPLPIC